MRQIEQSADRTLFIEDRGWLSAALASLAALGCGVIVYVVWAVDTQMGWALRLGVSLACAVGAFVVLRLVLATETRRITIDRAAGLIKVRITRMTGRYGWSAALEDVQNIRIERSAGSDGDWFEVILDIQGRDPLIFCQTGHAPEADQARAAMHRALER